MELKLDYYGWREKFVPRHKSIVTGLRELETSKLELARDTLIPHLARERLNPTAAVHNFVFATHALNFALLERGIADPILSVYARGK